jgi:hypothetical protein
MNNPKHPFQLSANENTAWKHQEQRSWKAPPSGGEEHSPDDGCGWEIFVVP